MSEKRILAMLLLACLAFTAASGCSVPQEDADFAAFLTQRYGTDGVELPSGEVASPFWLSLEKEMAEYSPNVVLAWWYDDRPEYYLDDAAIQSDLRALGELAIEYADSSGWSNDYYLWIVVESPTNCSFTLDYETGRFYVPLRYGILKDAIRQFNTVDPDSIASSKEGRDFLFRSGLADYKHGKFELDRVAWLFSCSSSKDVDVLSGGFSEREYTEEMVRWSTQKPN